MGHERLTEIRRLLCGALELPQRRRAAFLDAHCAAEPELRKEVEELLQRQDVLGTFLEQAFAADSWVELAPGDCLGEFEIGGLLAHGGTSRVYRAHQVALGGRGVALKVCSSALVTERARERFRREARLASSVHHRNLVGVLAYGEDPRRQLLYYAMRLVEGPTLAALLQDLARDAQTPTPDRQRLMVRRFLDVARGLAALHSEGLVHRDVKPGNIVLEGGADEDAWSRPAVLVDFGLVRPIAGEGQHSTRMATLDYAAPEVLLGHSAGGSADVFGLGMTMHDCLAGRRPEQRPWPAAQGAEPLHRLVPGIDADLAAVVDKATAPERQWRYADATALATDLEAWLESRPVRARRVRGLGAVRRWVRYHPGRVLVLAVRGLALALLVFVAVVGITRSVGVIHAAKQARRAWRDGDLAALHSLLAQTPDLAAHALLPAELASLRADLLAGQTEDPIANVLATAPREGRAASLLLATRYLERDGLRRHPLLARFLLNALGGPDPSLAECRLAARLFFERPDGSAECTRASVAFRSLLTRQLGAGLDAPRSGYVLTALSGCGAPASVPAILRWMEGPGRSGGLEARELVRLALRAMERIVRRGQACGFRTRLLDEDLDDLLPCATAVVVALDRSHPREHSHLRLALEDLVATVAFCRRALGVEPLPVDLACLLHQPSPRVRAAVLDPDLVDELREWRDDFNGKPVAERPAVFPQYMPYLGYGQLAGSYGSSELTAEFEARVCEVAAKLDLEAATCLRYFREGVARAIEELGGVRSSWEPDEDSHMGAFFERSRAALEPLPFTRGGPESRPVVASWDFLPAKILAFGKDVGVDARCVSLDEEDGIPGTRYARLSVFGVSELRLLFTCTVQNEGTLGLRLTLQNARRALLPLGGSSSIDVLLDGEAVATKVAVRGANRVIIKVPLCQARGVRSHVVAVRLNGSSETTLRVYSVQVLL